MKNLLVILFFPFSLFGQAAGEQEIRKNIDAFSAAIVNRDLDFITNAYTTDASIFPNHYDIIKGHAAIAAYWMPREGDTTTFHIIYPVEISIVDDTAYDHGYYEIRGVSQGKSYKVRGKYVIVWKKVEDDWKMYLDIWNRAG